VVRYSFIVVVFHRLLLAGLPAHAKHYPPVVDPNIMVEGASRFCSYPLQYRVIRGMLADMGRQVAVALYVVAMAAVIVGVDFVFFRNRFWERLAVNIGIVLVFAAFYFRFLRRP
jgi:hypothetical protein